MPGTIIKTKFSTATATPASDALSVGEQAYSFLTGGSGDRLYIGQLVTSGGITSVEAVQIGGKYYTDIVNAATNANTASTLVKRDGSGNFSAGTISAALTGNASTATAWATPRTLSLTGDATASLASVDGTAAVSAALTLATVNGNVGAFGSTTSIPVITVNAKGLITSVTTASITTTLGISGDTGTSSVALATDTLVFVGGTGLDSVVTSGATTDTVTFNIDSTVATLTGTQTFTNKTFTSPTINGATIGATGATFNGSTSGTITVLATAVAGSNSLTLPAATDTLVGRATTDTLTNKSIDLASNTFTATSAQLATAISDETGTGVIVFNNNPTLITPTLGAATATSINGLALTSSTGTLTIANSKTLTASNTLTFTGTDSSSVAFSAGGTVAYVANKLSVFAATTSAELAGVISDETGTGVLVFSNTPTLVTPVLGVATATSINKVAFTTPATGSTLTVADGKTLTASNTLTFTGTDSSSVAFSAGGTVAYVADKLSAFAATTSSELAGVISDETGSGSLVFASSPTLVTPTLGAALATSVTATSGNMTVGAASGNNSVNLVPTGTGTVDVANKRITSVAEPTQSSDAATKNYVDAVKTGLDVKDSVIATTTANLAATYSNGTSGVGATLTNSGTQAAITIDGRVLVVGERVLVKDQTTGLQNGFYKVTTVGTASVNWVLTRTVDADEDSEITPGAFTFVEEGTVGANNGYVCTNVGAITVGTTAITFVQFSGAGSVIAGDGLTKTGNTLNVVGTAGRISIAADAVDISSSYVGQATITTLGTITTGTWQGSVIDGTYGGTGVANTGKTITLGGNLTTSGAHATTVTTTANTTVTLPVSGTLATLAGTETFTNKTLTSPVIATIVNSGTLTLPTSTDTLVGRATTDTLTNKTISGGTVTGVTFDSSNATITGGSITGITDLVVADGGTGVSTFTSNGILYGNGTGAVQVTAAASAGSGNSGFFLSSNAGTPAWTNVIDGGTF